MIKIKNLKAKIENKYQCYKRRKGLKYKDFSIISNNCWGGFIYQMFGMKYTTPTIGLFMMESDYIKFLEKLKVYLEKDLVFIRPEQSRFYNQITDNGKKPIKYPVAKLGDIDIFFMHYTSQEEASTKWNRRKMRINFDRLIIKMSERNDCSPEIISRFVRLPYKNKICFTANSYNYPECVQIEKLMDLNKNGGDETPYTLEKINIYNVINNIRGI
jgi:uncharacterized protein (DUF1919 family)